MIEKRIKFMKKMDSLTQCTSRGVGNAAQRTAIGRQSFQCFEGQTKCEGEVEEEVKKSRKKSRKKGRKKQKR